ncbi:BirA family biotin operon repressor/biotin-[acetyl-CoA-carboxylase] ligase [Flavobacterium arsenatis]|uniref:BirA family biotin operon repressor/biotin-[acetyl-CoA-carboxylase] ligase n=1 Tax=Flavobacterium arsenatis TaxID=1484332 RepID=A0ABU1TRC3_9FLAO|nr:biotin--[acetyl-CoA-carboxylase] ligase [Flavobacterium arsenatis]MDR6968421.1 BirA family biotin operon repressor/biotin-[acetyl-CoA-carboxylase] ligase [Flavobacterium arsenatis]
MKLIKLDAIDSTNDFLKELLTNNNPENFTVITAEAQTKGKGQMGSVWVSENGKNLTMSILVKDFLFDINQIYNLNISVAVAIVTVLQTYNIPKLSIKWPNDIMSDNKKVGGILIENVIKGATKIDSIIGIGLNVNQVNFDGLPKASSLSLMANATFDKDELLEKIVEEIKLNISKLEANKSQELWIKYTDLLFKKGAPMPFENASEKRFMGIIQGVSKIGQLELLLEDDTVKTYGIKEIQMLY